MFGMHVDTVKGGIYGGGIFGIDPVEQYMAGL